MALVNYSTEEQPMTKMERALLSIGSVTCVVSIITLILTDSMIVIVAMLFGVICSTTVILRQRRISSKDTVRKPINVLKQLAKKYHNLNAELRKSINSLLPQASKVKGMEEQVEDLVRKNGMNMNEFNDSLYQNSKLLEEMREKMKLQTSQEILRLFFLSDRSKNNALDHNEVEILIVRLSVLSGVIFNEELFRNTFKKDVTLVDLCNLIKAMYDDDDDSEMGRVFCFNIRRLQLEAKIQ